KCARVRTDTHIASTARLSPMSTFPLRDLERYRKPGTNDTYAIPLPKTPSGKTIRECPREDCRPRVFQLGEAPEGGTIAPERTALVRRLPGQTGTTCPYCGIDAGDRE